MAAASTWNSPLQLLVVIVNYRRPDLVINCLRSLVPEISTVASLRVAVVDNPSGDNSVADIGAAIAANHWEDWAYLLPSPYNGGYAYGNNFAIRPALQSAYPPDFVLLLNPDTQVRPGALTALLSFMETHPTVGIAGSSFENADGSLWPIGFKFPSLLSEIEDGFRLGPITALLSQWTVPQTLSQTAQPIDWLPGASLIIRRQVFEAIGLMDEEYFLYYEETDFCLQAKRASWPCWYVPESRVMHIAGQSTGVTVRDQRPPRRPSYVFLSRRRFFVKNYGWLYTALADTCWAVGFSLWRFRRIIQRKPDGDPPHLLGDFIRNTVFFTRDISGRITPKP